jgi:hypothetical protein
MGFNPSDLKTLLTTEITTGLQQNEAQEETDNVLAYVVHELWNAEARNLQKIAEPTQRSVKRHEDKTQAEHDNPSELGKPNPSAVYKCSVDTVSYWDFDKDSGEARKRVTRDLLSSIEVDPYFYTVPGLFEQCPHNPACFNGTVAVDTLRSTESKQEVIAHVLQETRKIIDEASLNPLANEWSKEDSRLRGEIGEPERFLFENMVPSKSWYSALRADSTEGDIGEIEAG